MDNTINVKTLSYKFAGNRDAGRALARDLLASYPNFHETVEDEVKAQFYDGAYLRYAENGQRGGFYVREGDAYIETNEESFKKSKKDRVHLTVAFAVAESPQRFAQMKKDNPVLHALDRKSTRLNSSHMSESRMPSSA